MKKNQVFTGLFMMVAIMLMAFTFEPIAAMLCIAPIAGLVSSLKLKEQRSGFETELRTILEKAKTEKRDFSPEENTRRGELLTLIEDLDKQIELRMREEKIEARVISSVINDENKKQEDKEIRNFSFLGGLKQILNNGRLEGLEKEMDQEARKELALSGLEASGNFAVPNRILSKNNTAGQNEKRASLLAVSGGGDKFIETTNESDFISALYAKNVLIGLGAKRVDGLIGNLVIPKSGGATAAWATEVAAVADGTPTITSVSGSPKRLGAFGLLSKQLIMQAGNYSVEKLVEEDIISAINQALQVAAINGAGGTEPTGLLGAAIGSVAGGTNGLAPTAVHLISLEEAVSVLDADTGTLGFLTNPKAKSKLKRTTLDTGSGLFVWDLKTNDELIGYKAAVTTSVPSTLVKGASGAVCSAIIFGNFSDLVLANWGGFDVVVNPYSSAKNNQIEIVINTFWDILIRRVASFAAMKDALTV
jgi:HK97 family phage major capsid protein